MDGYRRVFTGDVLQDISKYVVFSPQTCSGPDSAMLTPMINFKYAIVCVELSRSVGNWDSCFKLHSSVARSLQASCVLAALCCLQWECDGGHNLETQRFHRWPCI